MRITLIDYGIGNLYSVRQALEKCGANVDVTSSAEKIKNADRLVLPGVGAFSHAMDEINSQGLNEILIEKAKSGTPFLGICLGMQMLLDESEEFGITRGLGLIGGRVVKIPSESSTSKAIKTPHIGWSPLVFSNSNFRDESSNFLKEGESVYFVHSYMAKTIIPDETVAITNFEGVRVAAIVKKDNIIGCQFHPEKSGNVGLNILKMFLLTS